MTECQKELLKLLKEIDSICRDNDIEYSLAGGTLIGAVRGGGYLPWDDDADIHMTRENVEKFVQVQKRGGFPPGRAITRKEDSEDYPNPIGRYVSLENTALQRSNFIEDIPKGLYIDIIVIQPIAGELTEEREARLKENWNAYSEIVTETYTLYSRRSDRIRRLYNAAKRLRPMGLNRNLYKHLIGTLRKDEDRETENYLILSHMMSNFFRGEDVKAYKRIPFEDTTLSVFANSEQVLRQAYGDLWFEVPKQSEREEHVIVYDFERPYTFYEEELSWYDVETERRKRVRKKDTWFDTMGCYNYVNPRTHMITGTAAVADLIAFVRSRKIDVRKWVDEGRYAELEDLFRVYYDTQFNSNHKYWDTYLDMPDDMLFAAWYPQMKKGNINGPRKIINKREAGRPDPLTEELETLREQCDQIGDFVNLIFTEGREEDAKAMLPRLLKENPDQIHLVRADLRFTSKDEDIEAEKALEKARSYLDIYPNDGELLKYTGDIYRRMGDITAAQDHYDMAEKKLINGLVIRELKDMREEADLR